MKKQRDDATWQKTLTKEQYLVLRKKGTEAAFTGAYWDHHDQGVYLCAGCESELFSWKNKYESGTGWPSFTQPLHSRAIETEIDHKLPAPRTEVHCAECGGHLGHVFEDGPAPNYLRYCLNSAALSFRPQE